MSEQPPHFLPMEARLKSTQLEPRTKSGSAYERAVADALLQEDHRPGRIEEEEAEIARKKQTDAPELLIAREKKADKLAERRNLEYQTKSAEETRSALADARALINEEPEVKHAATPVHSALSDVHNLLSDETGISAVRGLQDRKRSDEEIEKAGDISTLRTGLVEEVIDTPTRISNDMAKHRETREARIKEKERAEQAAQKLTETFKRVNGLIQLFGKELLQKKYNLSIPMIEGLSEDEINKLDRRLKAIQKEENKEMDRLYQEAEADRANRVDRERRQTSQVKTSTYEPKPQESIIVDDLDAMKGEEENRLWDEKIRLAKEIEAYMRDNFDAPLAESDKLIAQAEKQKEEERRQEEQAILQQWREQIPQMSLKNLNANAKQAFDIDFADQSTTGLTKVTELLNLDTVRGEIFRMLYTKFVEISTAQKRDAETKERRTEIAKQALETARTEMNVLKERMKDNLTGPQQNELYQLYKEQVDAKQKGDVPKVLDIIERTINTLKRFERLYEQLKKTGALKTSTPPTIKPPGLFSRIKSFFGGSKK